jgi:chorismate mutase/ribosomal protein S18 acetylase RimI-like enzyme
VTPTEAPELDLRPATGADADALADLFWAAREAAHPAMPRTVHTREECGHWFREVLGLEPRTTAMPLQRATWVATRRGELVGYVVVDPGWLDSLYVRPDLTGHGIGGVLLDLVKGLLPGGFGLWVFESNVRAQAFYERHGLVVVRRTDGSDNEERSPDLEMSWFGADPVAGVRRRIDDVDDRLAGLLAERAALTAVAQGLKDVPGEAGRDPDREAEIVARMARRGPSVGDRLGRDRLARIMHVVISESLDAAE